MLLDLSAGAEAVWGPVRARFGLAACGDGRAVGSSEMVAIEICMGGVLCPRQAHRT